MVKEHYLKALKVAPIFLILNVEGYILKGWKGLLITSLVYVWVLLAFLLSDPRIILPMVKKDIEDFNNGVYWTPFGKRKLPPGAKIEDVFRIKR